MIFSAIYFLIFIPLFSIDKKLYKTEQFTFDVQMEAVFNLFNNRSRQPVYQASIILMSICMLPDVIFILMILFASIFQLILLIKRECSFCGLY